MPAPPRVNPRAYGETTYTPPAQERPAPARPPYEPSYRQEGEAGGADYRPARQRPRPAARPLTNQEDDYGDVFEDDAPRAQRRASARDYNQAYRDVEDGYGDEERRSAGPWILLGFLLLAAIAAGATVWYYQTKVKTASPIAESGDVPVVTAPEQPAKTAAETPTEAASGAAEVPAADTKKQIYDRIVGDREVLGGEMVPTEEMPVPPPVQPEQGNTTAPADGGTQQPAAGDDTIPLPLPPPPGDGDASQSNTQGTLTAPVPGAANNATVEAASALPEPPPQPEAAPAASEAAETTPPETLELKDDQEAGEPKQVEAAPPAKPAKKVATKQKAKAKAKPKPAPEQEVSAADPLVLVPPAGGEVAVNAPQTGEAVVPAPKKKRTLLDLFRRDQSNAGAETQQPAQQQVAGVDTDQQVGSLPAPKPTQPAKPQVTPAPAGGYVAQLASFRSEAEAAREWGRIKSRHAGIVGGLAPRISKATVAGSTRYRLGVGPMADKSAASQVCNSLLAAGERDCIVRTQ
ncbi:MAG: SPOR domain-containing protein [Rhizobiales bacterium]|nr:SPOR domain-containing protein [Hyphomicrobiales bacterium]